MSGKRDIWSSRTAFILASIGSAVGLGNVWRFPYIAYKYGGGAFLIPFFVCIFVAGIPLLILEFYLGQSSQQGAPGAWKKIGKNWEILGWFAIFIGFVIVSYYAVIMGWAFGYLGKSLSLNSITSWETFFYKDFLNLSPSITQLGGIRLVILFGLLLTWISMVLIVFKGTKSVGKVVMITVPLPFLILILFVIRGAALPGASQGLKYFLTPDFNALLKVETWLAAFGQVFYSFSIGFGVMIAYASFKKRDSDITNNAFITGITDGFTAYLAGFAVFSALGFLAMSKGVPVPEVVSSGPGLAFAVFPEIITRLPFAPFFFILFFIMLLTLGIDSAFSLVEAFITGLSEKLKVAKYFIIYGTAILGFLLGIIYTTEAGLLWLDAVDYFCNNYGLVIVVIIEAIVIGWIHKASRARAFINERSEIKIGLWWDITIKFVIPITLIVLIILNTKNLLTDGYEGYPARVLMIAGPSMLLFGLIFSIIMKGLDSGISKRETVIITMSAAFILFSIFYLFFDQQINGFFKMYSPVIMGIFGFLVLSGGLVICFKKMAKGRIND